MVKLLHVHHCWLAGLLAWPLISAAANPAAAEEPTAAGPAADRPVSRLVERFEPPVLREGQQGTRVSVAGCDTDVEPGAPALPMRGVTLAIPEGWRAGKVRIVPGASTVIALDRPVACAQQAVPLMSGAQTPRVTPRDSRIYGRRRPYPDFTADEALRQRRDRLHGEDFLTVTLHPVQYRPAGNQLLCHGELTLEVTWEQDDGTRDDGWRPRRRGARGGTDAAGATALPLATGAVQDMVDTADGEGALSYTGLLPPGTFDHVIIAPARFIADTPPPWNFAALSAARATAGLSSTNVAVEWIDCLYPGRDQAERIRAFVRDAYENWSTRFVLLGGSATNVATRRLYCRFDTYSAQIPSDALYYGCLNGDFDFDGDNIFGELGDGSGGGDVDLLAEVDIGRFPVESPEEVARMVRKTLAYEATAAEALAPVAHVGEYIGFGGVADYATGAMEQIRLGATDAGFTSLGFESPPYGALFDTTGKLYDAPGYRWTAATMLALFGHNMHVFNHLGHGAPLECFKINVASYYPANRQAIANLTNTVYYLAYSQACDAGSFDTVSDCFAEQLATSAGGAFTAVMNTRSGWGYANSIDGPSQRFHRKFWDAVFSGKAYHLGRVNMRARENLIHLISPYYADAFRWCYYEITLFGDPATPFAARLLQQAPTFAHAGLANSYVTNAPYTVAAELGPASLYDPATPRLVWRASSAPGEVRTNALTRMARHLFSASIPAQPMGTTIHYSLHGATLAGVAGRWPDEGEHQFAITPPLALSVDGAPGTYGTVTPPYGIMGIASGTVVRATAPPRVALGAEVSMALEGYSGSGSVGAGAGGEALFTMAGDSALTWHWQLEYALRQTSNVPGHLASLAWHRPGAVATSAAALPSIASGGQTYRFAGWYLDEERRPPAPGRATNIVSGVIMSTGHVARALYLPDAQDLDANGLRDWWECLYFGANGQDAASDEDDDGFNLLEEFADNTDPFDAASYPCPPQIAHLPLLSPQAVPPPYPVAAIISDSHSVADARMRWRRNDEQWREQAMLPADGERYEATLPAPGVPRDLFSYEIVASDSAGYTATSGPHTVFLRYPQAGLSPTGGVSVLLTSEGVDATPLALTNSGNATLVWSVGRGLYEPITTPWTEWNTNAGGQPWRIATNRCASAPHAFHGAPDSSGVYNSPPVHARLASPPLHPAAGARLFFKYWIRSELDVNKPGGAWDGGIVEISRDGGLTYSQLAGPYTHRITGWTSSPWPDGTPCFAGDGTEGWREAGFDLGAHAGQTILLRFTMGGDNNTDLEGWYLDDLRIGPVGDPPWPAWAACGASGGMLAANYGLAFPLFSLAAETTLRDDLLPLHIVSNDPVEPNLFMDWRLKIRDPPRLERPFAAQSSTNGEGLVTLTVAASEADGEPLTLEIGYSRDHGATWERPPLLAVQASLGSCRLNMASSMVEEVATALSGAPATNCLAMLWESRATQPALPALATGLLMRVRAISPYRETAVTTPPFMLDNEPPSAPGAHVSSSHTIGVWSPASRFDAAWGAADDGAGIGGILYRHRLAEGVDDLLDGAPLTAATTASLAAADGADLWFAVQAQDAYGNRSAIVRGGAYRIDTLPPASGTAWVSLQRSMFGPYAVGPLLQATWGGFQDALSGVAGYYIFQQAGSSLTPPQHMLATQATLNAAHLGITNTLLVFAVDQAGNASGLASHSLWVMDHETDVDGDGYSAAAEELVGSDASDGESVLRLGIVAAPPAEGGVGLVWRSLAGRRYTLLGSVSLAPANWQPLAGLTGLPGSDAVVTNLVPADSATYYRLLVTP